MFILTWQYGATPPNGKGLWLIPPFSLSNVFSLFLRLPELEERAKRISAYGSVDLDGNIFCFATTLLLMFETLWVKRFVTETLPESTASVLELLAALLEFVLKAMPPLIFMT